MNTIDLPLITKLSETTPRARKDYTCLICGLPIRKGEQHQKFVCLDDDTLDSNKFRSFRSHIQCPEPEL